MLCDAAGESLAGLAAALHDRSIALLSFLEPKAASGLMRSVCSALRPAHSFTRRTPGQKALGLQRAFHSGSSTYHSCPKRERAAATMAEGASSDQAGAVSTAGPAQEVDPTLVALALQQHPRIILGTGSSSRRGILDELAKEYGFSYEVAKADIDEKAIRHEDAHHLVLRLAHAKAAAIAAKLEAAEGPGRTGLLITCDQVVLHEGQILEKPEDEAQAREYIAGYARAPASTVGSVVLTDLATGLSWEGVDVAEIHFEPIPPAAVDQLVAEGEVFWCAGGLMVEHALVQPHVTRMEGSLDSVMGLDKRLLLRLLCAAGAAGAAPANGGAAQ